MTAATCLHSPTQPPPQAAASKAQMRRLHLHQTEKMVLALGTCATRALAALVAPPECPLVTPTAVYRAAPLQAPPPPAGTTSRLAVTASLLGQPARAAAPTAPRQCGPAATPHPPQRGHGWSPAAAHQPRSSCLRWTPRRECQRHLTRTPLPMSEAAKGVSGSCCRARRCWTAAVRPLAVAADAAASHPSAPSTRPSEMCAPLSLTMEDGHNGANLVLQLPQR